MRISIILNVNVGYIHLQSCLLSKFLLDMHPFYVHLQIRFSKQVKILNPIPYLLHIFQPPFIFLIRLKSKHILIAVCTIKRIYLLQLFTCLADNFVSATLAVYVLNHSVPPLRRSFLQYKYTPQSLCSRYVYLYAPLQSRHVLCL